MSNRVRERRLAAQATTGRPTKRERRVLGKQAAAARARARRRRIFLKNGGVVIGAVLVVGLIVAGFTLFHSSPPPAPTANQDLGTKPVVTKGEGTVTSLKVTPIITGTGPVVKSGDTISVNYVGVNYATGEQFDASWDHTPAAPFSTEIGTGNVIKGWDQALVGRTVGSRLQIDIPAALAYPDQTSGPTAGALRFVVDILSTTSPSASASASPGASASPAPSASLSSSP